MYPSRGGGHDGHAWGTSKTPKWLVFVFCQLSFVSCFVSFARVLRVVLTALTNLAMFADIVSLENPVMLVIAISRGQVERGKPLLDP